MAQEKLGRLYSNDVRDLRFTIAGAIPAAPPTKTKRYWNANGWWGDQKDTPQCVGYSWAHWVEDGPVTQVGTAPIIKPQDIYKEAQKIDEWIGENYDGTSVRAGAKYLASKGLIKEYRWGFNVNDLANAVLTTGPVVVGTNWYDEMFEPDSAGLVKIKGYIAGGHAYLINGVNMKTKRFRIKNSWGRDWGKQGHAYISFDDMARLISEYGEMCLALENKIV